MKKSGTILIIIATVVLGGIALFTAIRLYQQGTQPVAPNVPGSTPSAADVTEACQTITFSVSSPTPTVAPSATPTPSTTPTPSFPPVTTATPSPSPTPTPTPTQPPTGGIATPTPTPTPTPIVIVTPAPSFPPVAQATPLTTAPPIPVTGGELPTLAAIFGAIIFIVVALRFAL